MENPFHKHTWKLKERSNIIQYDNMGHVLRLFIVKCSCGKSKQMWIDSAECISDCVCKWFKENTSIPIPPKAEELIKTKGEKDDISSSNKISYRYYRCRCSSLWFKT